MEKWGDAEISINRWLSVICRVMKTFPCRKSFSFLTTSLGRHTQQIPSLCLFNINRKNKRRLWRMVAGGNIWLKPHSANHSNMKKKTYMKKHRHQAAAWFIFPPSSQFQEFYEWKMSGDSFSKATMACVSWAYHAVLVSSCCLEPPERRDPHSHFTSCCLTFNWQPYPYVEAWGCEVEISEIKTATIRSLWVGGLCLKTTIF